MKKIISLLLALALLFACVPAAFADDVSTPEEDPVILEYVASGGITFSGTTATCVATVSDPGKSIVATMTLTHNGASAGSWSDSGNSSVDLYGECTVVKGWTYTLTVSGTINGVPFSRDVATKTC